jgi:sporulation killing factor
MDKAPNKGGWVSIHSPQQAQPTDSPLIKSAGCAACWAAKSVSLTSACWECEVSLAACAI